MKFLKVTGYVLLAILTFIVLFFGGLYLRYSGQSPAIHRTVNVFMQEAKRGDSDALQTLVHPNFVTLLNELLTQHGDSFTHVTNMTEQSNYFDYSWKLGVGETTEYHGDVSFDNGQTGVMTIQLIKYGGKWVVYGLDLKPNSDSPFKVQTPQS